MKTTVHKHTRKTRKGRVQVRQHSRRLNRGSVISKLYDKQDPTIYVDGIERPMTKEALNQLYGMRGFKTRVKQRREALKGHKDYLLYGNKGLLNKSEKNVVSVLDRLENPNRIPLVKLGPGRYVSGRVLGKDEEKKLDSILNRLPDNRPLPRHPLVDKAAKRDHYRKLAQDFNVIQLSDMHINPRAVDIPKIRIIRKIQSLYPVSKEREQADRELDKLYEDRYKKRGPRAFRYVFSGKFDEKVKRQEEKIRQFWASQFSRRDRKIVNLEHKSRELLKKELPDLTNQDITQLTKIAGKHTREFASKYLKWSPKMRMDAIRKKNEVIEMKKKIAIQDKIELEKRKGYQKWRKIAIPR